MRRFPAVAVARPRMGAMGTCVHRMDVPVAFRQMLVARCLQVLRNQWQDHKAAALGEFDDLCHQATDGGRS